MASHILAISLQQFFKDFYGSKVVLQPNKNPALSAGLPDPPVDVQVEMGPQDGSLLVTWLPVTIDSSGGKSNGATVTGYAVYADGKKVTEVESPTGIVINFFQPIGLIGLVIAMFNIVVAGLFTAKVNCGCDLLVFVFLQNIH